MGKGTKSSDTKPETKNAWTESGSGHTQSERPQVHHSKFLFFGRDRVEPIHVKLPSYDQNKETYFDEKKLPISSANSSREGSSSKKHEPKGPKPTLWQRILLAWADDESNLRLSWPIVVIILFSFICGGIVYAIENGEQITTFWMALYFVNTIYTTIGYGTPAPKTAAGKAVSVIIAIIGIPLNVLALANLGRIMARFLHYIYVLCQRFWRLLKRCCSRRPKNAAILKEENSAGGPQSEDVPLSFGLVMTILWFLISALFFHLTEPDTITNFGDAFYFLMISVTTIGFGDVAPVQYQLVILQFVFIIIGIALFSMIINIIQDKIDHLSDTVEVLISKEYSKAQQDGTNLAADEKSARNHIKQIMKQQKGGGLLQMVMGKNMENRLVEDYLDKARKRLVATQTDNIVHDVSITAFPSMEDFSVMVLPSDSSNTKDKGTQLRWMPKMWNNLDWLDLMYPDRTTKQHKPLTQQKTLSRSNTQQKTLSRSSTKVVKK